MRVWSHECVLPRAALIVTYRLTCTRIDTSTLRLCLLIDRQPDWNRTVDHLVLIATSRCFEVSLRGSAIRVGTLFHPRLRLPIATI